MWPHAPKLRLPSPRRSDHTKRKGSPSSHLERLRGIVWEISITQSRWPRLADLLHHTDARGLALICRAPIFLFHRTQEFFIVALCQTALSLWAEPISTWVELLLSRTVFQLSRFSTKPYFEPSHFLGESSKIWFQFFLSFSAPFGAY